MMMSQEEVEKLDYLTIIPDSVPSFVTVIPARMYTDREDYVVIDNRPFEYSLDDGATWWDATADLKGEDDADKYLRVYVTSSLKLKANLLWTSSIKDTQSLSSMQILPDATYTVSGSIMSLCYGDDFSSYTGELTWPMSLFYMSKTLRKINTPKTLLSATSFKYADSSDTSGAYENMFYNCTKLENAPEIHLAHIGLWDCASMFYKCVSLTTASVIHSLSVGRNGCNSMFDGCTSLVKAPSKLPATLEPYCFLGMFYNCKALERAPELPAITLVSNCYNYMFDGCSKLNYVKAKFTTTPGSSYTNSWLRGTAATGTFVKNKDATWNVTGVDGIPSGWTVVTE